jgi:toxin ParE1/3/4
MPRIVRAPLAKQDLKQIGRFIARESGSRDVALRLLESIDNRIRIYAAQPELGEARPDLDPVVRCFPIGNYVVFYRPTAGGIEVLRVLHGNRDLPAVWRNQPQ